MGQKQAYASLNIFVFLLSDKKLILIDSNSSQKITQHSDRVLKVGLLEFYPV